MTGQLNHDKTYFVIGAGGFVGGYIYHELKTAGCAVTGTTFPEASNEFQPLDITNTQLLADFMSAVRPHDVVIVTAAIANVDWCEQHPDEAKLVNVKAVQEIADICFQTKARLIFFSSEYVFDGVAGPYSESDLPRPLNIYGQQKLASENYISEHLTNYLIIRTTTVYGYEEARKNFLMSFIDRMRGDQVVLIPEDQISTPTYVLDLAQTTLALARSNFTGVLHVVGPEKMTRVELAKKMSAYFHLDEAKIRPVATTELKQLAHRPLQAGLTIDTLQSYGYVMHTVDQALPEIAKKYGRSI